MRYFWVGFLFLIFTNTAQAKLSNGAQCTKRQQCASDKCFPYVDNKRYCIHRDWHCAMPNSRGRRWGQPTEYQKKSYICTQVTGWTFSASTTAKKIATNYNCKTARDAKFNETVYKGLSSLEQTTVDGTYRQCLIDKKAKLSGKPAEELVVFTANPLPINEDDKVFYGIVKRKDLENATKNCLGVGEKVGLTIAVAGASPAAMKAAGFLYEYSDVSCKGLKNAIEDDNLMTLIAPTNIIANSASEKYISDVVKKMPLVSKGDKKKIIKIYKKANRKLQPKFKIKGRRVSIKLLGKKISFDMPKL